jgi:serine protease Do
MYPKHILSTRSSTRRARLPLALALAGLLGATALSAPSVLAESTANTTVLGGNIVEIAAPAIGFADLVEQVQPAVVSVQVSAAPVNLSSADLDDQAEPERRRESEEDSDNSDRRARKPSAGDESGAPYQHDEGQENSESYGAPNSGQESPHAEETAEGSGFIISADGYVVTNHHVIEGGGIIDVTLSDGRTYRARLIGEDSKTDLALLKIESEEEFEFVSFTDAEARVGDWVVAVGNPFGLGGSVTTGIVSARGRDIGSGPYDDYIQIDAPINRGNSGGPAFNLNGEVLGVNTAIYSPSGGNVGIGFAIPANIASEIIDELRENGVVTRGWLGVHIQSVTAEIAESLDLEGAEGALVAQVADDSPAGNGGVRPGDLILQVGEANIEDPRELARVIAAVDPGTDVDLTVFRDGELMTIGIEIGIMPGTERQASLEVTEPEAGVDLASLGLSLSSADGGGVLIEDVNSGGPAADSGLTEGDLIIEAGGERVTTPSEVEDRLAAMQERGRNSLLLLVRSGNRQRFVVLHIDES